MRRKSAQELQAKEGKLAARLVQIPASTGWELSLKALIALEWLPTEDLAGALIASLCKDAIRIFPPNGLARV
jgi:hypothetical protein